MRTKTVIYLDSNDLEQVTFKTRFICDRLDLLPDGVRSVFSRKDIYWIEVTLNEKDLGAYAVEGVDKDGTPILSQNWNEVGGEEAVSLITRAKAWFITQPEYPKMVGLIAQRNSYKGPVYIFVYKEVTDPEYPHKDGDLDLGAYASKKEAESHFQANQHHYKEMKEVSMDEYKELYKASGRW